MKITITVAGDTVAEIAAELAKMAAQFGVQEVSALALDTEPKKLEPRKTTRKKPEAEPEPEPEKEEPEAEKPEQEPGGDEKQNDEETSSPEADWDKASDMLLKFWTANPEKKDIVIGVAKEFGVEKFAQIPKEKGTEFLAKAREVVG